MKSIAVVVVAVFVVVMGTMLGCAGARAKDGALGAVGAAQPTALHQEVDFEAGPARIYQALLDSRQFSALSGAPAEINPEAGGAFSLFGAHITGRNVELIPNQRVVQAWRSAGWPAGVYSIARFELSPRGSGTHLVFDHVGFREGERDHLAQGWEGHYWAMLRKCPR